MGFTKLRISRILLWSRVASVVGVEASAMQHATVYSAAATVGYISRDVFDDIRREPLSLTQGDIAENVRQLMLRAGEPSDATTRKLKRLLEAGEPQGHIVDALVLLRDAPCSSALVEEGHAAGSVLKKHHEGYGEAALRARALVHQMRALGRPSKGEKKLRAIDDKLAKLDSQKPERVHSRQTF